MARIEMTLTVEDGAVKAMLAELLEAVRESAAPAPAAAPASMLKIREAAEKYGISHHHARQLVLRRDVRYVMAGKTYLVNEASLAEYLAAGHPGPDTPA